MICETSQIRPAIHTFIGGFCFTRSFTHPFISEKVGPLWVMRDGPRRDGDYRNEEWIVNGVAPEQAHGIIRQHARGRHFVCVLCPAGQRDAPLRQAYKALGYRLLSTESLMVHDLKRIPMRQCPAAVRRITTDQTAAQANKSAGHTLLKPEHLCKPSPVRVYAATLDNEMVGWVRSIAVGNRTWCASMFVSAKHRRKGIGSALVGRMLRDDRKAGARTSVLLASHAGAALYASMGYQTLGTLLLYAPRLRS